MSDKNDVKIDISGDVSGFSGATAEAERELNRLKDAAQKTGSSLSDLAKNALPKVAEEVAAVSGVSSELVMGVAAMGAGFVAASLAGVTLYQAMSQGREEMLAMNRAIAASGGYAGQTQQDMLDLSRSVAEVGTVTVAQSKAVVTALVSSGRIASESIGEIARLAENYAAVTGASVATVGPQLVKLFADPAKGAAQLNEQMHFLTSSQLEYIEALQEAGNKGEAQLELSRRLKDVLPEHAKELTYLGTIWANTEKVASAAWDAMLGIGKEDSLEQRLRDAKGSLENGTEWLNNLLDRRGKVAVLQAAADKEQADAASKSAAAKAAENESTARGLIAQYSDSAKRASLQQKKDFVSNYAAEGQEKIEALKKIQAEIDKVGFVKPKKQKIDDSEFKANLSAMKEEARAELELMQQRDKANSLLASYDRQDKISEQRIARAAELALMSERERVAAEAVYRAQDESARRQEQIIKQISDETEKTKALATEKDQLAGHIDRVREASLKSHDDQKTFEFGWSRSFKKYQDDASNAAKTAETVFTSATDAMADAGTKLAMRQKVNFNDIANSFVAMIIRMQMQQAAAAVVSGGGGFLGNLFGMISGSIGGAGSSIYNGSVQGNSDYVYDLHGGGLAGFGGSSNNLRDMSMFNSAPRFHSGSGGPIGLRSDEVPAVLLKGERVLNRQETADYGKGSGPIPFRVELINNGTPQKVDSAQPSIDVNGMVIRLITSDINSQGPISKTMETRFGLNRAAGSYA